MRPFTTVPSAGNSENATAPQTTTIVADGAGQLGSARRSTKVRPQATLRVSRRTAPQDAANADGEEIEEAALKLEAGIRERSAMIVVCCLTAAENYAVSLLGR